MKKPVVEIFFFDAGGGHRNAMTALKAVLSERYPEWQVKPVDLQKLLEPVDPIHRTTAKIPPSMQKLLGPVAPGFAHGPVQSQEVYNRALKKGVTRGSGFMLSLLQILIRKNYQKIECLLRAHWQSVGKPDLVVSVIPNFNGVMFRALKASYPYVPYVTVITDMVDHPPHFWMEDQDQFMICGTRKAFEQALNSGFYDPDKVTEVSGMILKKIFYDRPETPRLAHRELGLSPHIPTALIMFGGNGSLVSLDIVEQLRAAELGVQTIVICGHNKELLQRLQGIDGCHAVGFVPNVADYMAIADIFIGKPGPGSISEAIHMGCPVIVERNAATMPQERPNVDWILENGVGISVRSFSKEIIGAVQCMMDNFDQYKQNIRKIKPNHSVFEIADRLDFILKTDFVLEPTIRDTKKSFRPIFIANIKTRWKKESQKSP